MSETRPDKRALHSSSSSSSSSSVLPDTRSVLLCSIVSSSSSSTTDSVAVDEPTKEEQKEEVVRRCGRCIRDFCIIITIIILVNSLVIVFLSAVIACTSDGTGSTYDISTPNTKYSVLLIYVLITEKNSLCVTDRESSPGGRKEKEISYTQSSVLRCGIPALGKRIITHDFCLTVLTKSANAGLFGTKKW
ncbi:hypothetical protein TSAR_000558 [Trichomalopsis sarcophagae]|uniref:Uncharacterized protein n=1 Tax=Trichomalopsis sarcophagae TaxID=543379 RepID=A0A232F847_9HYME|nr:hypothetical protein TSAR_000558 [Trichomalopsis sarcophagae]